MYKYQKLTLVCVVLSVIWRLAVSDNTTTLTTTVTTTLTTTPTTTAGTNTSTTTTQTTTTTTNVCKADGFDSIESLILECSGDSNLVSRTVYPHTGIFFFVTYPCCNPCPYANQTIRFHPATPLPLQKCFFYEGTVMLDNITQLNASTYELQNMQSKYYLDTYDNTVKQSTSCSAGFFAVVSNSIYFNVQCQQRVSCNEITQYENNNECFPKTPVNPRHNYIASFGGPFSDNVVVNKTNCNSFGMYTIPSADIDVDHQCVEYTVCDSQWLYELIPATSTSDRVCNIKTTCTKGEYYDTTAHMDRIDDFTGNIRQHCFPCKQGTYQDNESHFFTSCAAHDPINVCLGPYSYSRLSVEEMSTVLPTDVYCVTVEVPTGYEYHGKDSNGVPIIKISQNLASALSSAASRYMLKTAASPCMMKQYALHIGEFEDNFICMECSACHHTQVVITPCGAYTDTVCGESPQVEAMYALGLAAYLCYVVGALTLYRLHFVTKNEPK